MGISDLDFRLLAAFVVLMEERNVTRAADRLGLSQPAASAVLAKLRRVFGDPLMVRTPRGMMPTPRAETLLPQIQQVLATLERLVSSPAGFQPAEAQLTLSLAAVDYVQAIVLPPLLSYLEQAAPQIKIIVRPIEVERLEQQMERGEVDLALIPQGNAPKALTSQVLLHEEFVCVASRKHLQIQKQIDLDQYCRSKHILVSPRSNDLFGVVDRVLTAQDRSRPVSLSIPNFLLVPEIIESSQWLATIPRRLAMRYQKRWQILKLPLDVPGFTIASVWHPKNQQDSAQTWLRDTVAQIVRDL